MKAGRRYVLVNTFGPEEWLLCDYAGETYESLSEALVARDEMRAEADNPWIDVLRLEPVDVGDLE